jgi:hypothetical protein
MIAQCTVAQVEFRLEYNHCTSCSLFMICYCFTCVTQVLTRPFSFSYAGSSDLELAIALQQQEFERQPQRFQPPPPQQQQQQQQQPQIQHQPTQSGRPGLVVGPRVRFLCSIIAIVYSYCHQNLISYYHLCLSALRLGLF